MSSSNKLKYASVNFLVLLGCLLAMFFIGECCVRLVMVKKASRVELQTNSNVDLKETAAIVSIEGQAGKKLFRFTEAGIRLIPNMRATIYNHALSGNNIEIRTNSLGYRGPEITAKAENEFRLLVLGDSITEGDAVLEEQTYVNLLREKLAGELANGMMVESINAGVNAADIEDEYFILKETGLLTEPDIIIIGLYLNDANASVGIKPLPYPLSQSEFLNYFYRRWIILDSQYIRTRRADWERKWIQDFKGARKLKIGDWRSDSNAFDAEIIGAFRDWGYAWSEQSWKHISSILKKFNELEQIHRIKTVVLLFPVKYQVEADFVNDLPQRYFNETLKQQGMRGLDLLPELRKIWSESKETFYYDQCHLNPYGHEVVADIIARYLKSEKLVPLGGLTRV